MPVSAVCSDACTGASVYSQGPKLHDPARQQGRPEHDVAGYSTLTHERVQPHP